MGLKNSSTPKPGAADQSRAPFWGVSARPSLFQLQKSLPLLMHHLSLSCHHPFSNIRSVFLSFPISNNFLQFNPERVKEKWNKPVGSETVTPRSRGEQVGWDGHSFFCWSRATAEKHGLVRELGFEEIAQEEGSDTSMWWSKDDLGHSKNPCNRTRTFRERPGLTPANPLALQKQVNAPGAPAESGTSMNRTPQGNAPKARAGSQQHLRSYRAGTWPGLARVVHMRCEARDQITKAFIYLRMTSFPILFFFHSSP